MQRIIALIGLIALAMGSLLPAPTYAQGTPPSDPPPLQVVHYPCGYGAWIADGSICVHGRIYDAAGILRAGITVNLEWRDAAGRLITDTDQTRPRPTDRVDEPGFLFILPSAARPGRTRIKLWAMVDGRRVEQELPLRPDPVLLSQQVPLFVQAGALPPWVVRVFRPSVVEGEDPTQKPTVLAEVQAIFTNAQGAMITRTLDPLVAPLFGNPIYGFNPTAAGVPSGAMVSIVAEVAASGSDPAADQRGLFVWDGTPQLLDLYAGWGCDYIIPRRGSKTLPERFCLAGRITADGQPVADDQARILVGAGPAQAAATTGTITNSGQLNYALEIGGLVGDGDGPQLLISAVGPRTNYAFQISPYELLHDNPRRTLRIDLPLRPDWAVRGALPVRVTPRAEASLGDLRAILVPGSGVWLLTNAEWRYPDPRQPCRNGTAVSLSAIDGQPVIMCKDHAGAVHRSTDLGRTWEPDPTAAWPATPLPPVTTSADTAGFAESVSQIITSRAADGQALIFAAAQEGVLYGRNVDSSFAALPAIPSPQPAIKALAVCRAGAQDWLVALGVSGIWRIPLPLVDPAGWQAMSFTTPPASLNGSALAALGDRLVLGRTAGTNQVWSAADCGAGGFSPASFSAAMRSAVTGLVATESALVLATDGQGLWRSTDGQSWAPAGAPAGAPPRPRISALATGDDSVSCAIYAAVLNSTPADNLWRGTCAGDSWEGGGGLPPDQTTVALGVTQIGDATYLFAAGSGGICERRAGGDWRCATPGQSPIRLQALALSPGYAATPLPDRSILTGGARTGVLIYNSSAPDLSVEATIANAKGEPTLRPGEPFTVTVRLENVGAAPAFASQVTLTPTATLLLDTAPVAETGRALLPGETATLTWTGKLADINPPPADRELPIAVQADLIDQTDGYALNNRDTVSALSLPRRGPDPEVTILLRDRPRQKADRSLEVRLRVRYANIGEEAARNVVVTLSGPAGVTISPNSPVRRARIAGSEERVGTICAGQACEQSYTATIPAALAGSPLTLTATIQADNDRDESNNQADLTITPGAPDPVVLFVRDSVRMTDGPEFTRLIASARTHPTAPATVLNLQSSSYWQRINAALLAGDTARAVAATVELNDYTRRQIFAQVALYPSITYVVLLGGDRVIPYGVVKDQVVSAGDGLTERAFVQLDPRIPTNTPVYATLYENYYPSDLIFGLRPGIDPARKPQLPELIVSRLVERPDEILRLLRGFYDPPTGVSPALNAAQIGMVGFAPEITEDHYEQACERPYMRCTTTAGTDPLQLDLGIVGDHSSPWEAGSIDASLLVDRVLSQTRPFAMTVGCHTGLNFRRSQQGDVTLPGAVLSGGKQPIAAYIGSLPYAYGSTGGIDYNEKLALRFQELVFERRTEGNATIGGIFLDTLRAYVERQGKEDMTALDWKVIYGLALYGLPVLTVESTQSAVPGQALAQPEGAMTASAALPTARPIAGTRLYEAQLSLDLDFTPVEDPVWGDATSFFADYGPGIAHAGRRGQIGSRQPYYETVIEPITLDDGTTLSPLGAIFDGASLSITRGFDPLIVQPLPLSERPRTIEEPADPVRFWEHSDLLVARRTADGRLYVRLWLGTYFRQGADQELWLLRNPQLRVIYGPQPNRATSLEGRAICRDTRSGIISIAGSGLNRAFVTYTHRSDWWRTVPMEVSGSNLAVQVPADPNLRFYVQVIDKFGNVSHLTPNSRGYFGAYTARCTPASDN